MKLRAKDRHLYGAGAAACAVCCAPPLLALLGIAGVGLTATLATIAFAGVTFGLVMLSATLVGIWTRRRRAQPDVACSGATRPVEVTIGSAPPADPN